MDLAWVAGLLEGEGSFYTLRTRHQILRPVVQLTMTDRDVVERFAQLVGVGVTTLGDPKHLGYRDSYRARAQGARAAVLMHDILPLMGERRRARILEVLQLSGY